jgi:hypothetical protein
MLSGPIRERKKYFNNCFTRGWTNYTDANDAADLIIESPDRFLLNSDELFLAEGGWATFALTMSLAAASGTAMIMLRPGMAGHFARGQLRAIEWIMLGGAAATGGFVGDQFGIRTFGNLAKYENHWMAYMFVKTQNRYVGGSILGKTPTY